MEITFPAKVARTADELKHVNHLGVPHFAVTKLVLKSVGGKSSKSYSPPGAKDEGSSDTFHFAPKQEKVKITYQLENPLGEIKKAKLELFRRNSNKAVWTRDLKPEEMTDGEHQLEWDGKITKSADFPEEYVTLQHSPYKLKITLGGDIKGDPPTAWTYFHVLVAEIALQLGDKTSLSQARDKTFYDTIVDLPASGKTKEVKLLSNLFSTGSDKADNTLFTTYRDKWQDGPNIPVFAKIWIKDSADAKQDVPEAIGTVKLFWDWEDVEEDLSMHFAEAKEYLKDSLDRFKATTKPKGDNCHKDHGGKRGDAAKFIFPAQAGYAPAAALTADTFPFKVVAGGTRKWASYSETWNTGKLKGMTGVLFQPSRMAGDTYKLTVLFAYNRKADGTDDLDSEDNNVLKNAVKKETGKFQIWREVHLIKYCKKDNSIPTIPIAKVQGYYDKAYIRLEDKTGGAIQAMANYDTKLRAQVNTQSQDRKSAVAAGDQGTITKSAIKFRSYADFKTQFKADSGKNDAQLNAWLTANNVQTSAKYEDYLEALTDAVVPKACNDYLSASDGINILQFDLYWEAGGGLESGTNGFASTDFPSGSRTKAAYLQTRVRYGAGSKNNMQQTTTHEVGHILFLPHAHSAGGFVEALHDNRTHWNNCTMSYNYDKERKFCGLCLLRLRGWDQTNLSKDRANNKKP